jgi:hypothetical protein
MDDHIKNDYDTDYLVWLERQAELLRAKQFERLDLEHLIEEIDAMAGQLRRELAHRLEILLLHLLKFRYQPTHASNGWRGTVSEQRRRIKRLLKQMPSLHNLIDEYLEDVYDDAVDGAAAETGLPKATFPKTNPFTPQQVFDPDYLP